MDVKQFVLSRLKDTDDNSKNIESMLKSYQDSLIYTKSCASDVQDEEDAIVREYKRYILEEGKPHSFVTPEQKFNYEDKRRGAAFIPRLVSLEGFRRLFEE